MKYKILAQSGKGEGMLPMKQGEEQEDKKPKDQKNTEFCNFLKNAFCVDGGVLAVSSKKPFNSNLYFILEDSKRGKFAVAIKNIKP